MSGGRGPHSAAGADTQIETPAREHRTGAVRLANGLAPTIRDTSRRPWTQLVWVPSVVGLLESVRDRIPAVGMHAKLRSRWPTLAGLHCRRKSVQRSGRLWVCPNPGSAVAPDLQGILARIAKQLWNACSHALLQCSRQARRDPSLTSEEEPWT